MPMGDHIFCTFPTPLVSASNLRVYREKLPNNTSKADKTTMSVVMTLCMPPTKCQTITSIMIVPKHSSNCSPSSPYFKDCSLSQEIGLLFKTHQGAHLLCALPSWCGDLSEQCHQTCHHRLQVVHYSLKQLCLGPQETAE